MISTVFGFCASFATFVVIIFLPVLIVLMCVLTFVDILFAIRRYRNYCRQLSLDAAGDVVAK